MMKPPPPLIPLLQEHVSSDQILLQFNDLINKVNASLQALSEEQRAFYEALEKLQEQLCR